MTDDAFPRTPCPSAAAVRRRTYDRVCAALPDGFGVTPREAWRLAGAVGSPASVNHVLRGLEAEGRAARAGKLLVRGNAVGANLWRRL